MPNGLPCLMIFFRPYHIAAALMTGCFFMSACENDPNEVNNIYRKKTSVEEATQVTVTYTIGGNTRAILQAPLMLNVQDTGIYVEFPKTLHADFYNPSGIVESKLDALYAKYRRNESIVYIRDSVKVVNLLKGDTLYCDELYWDRSRVGNEFYTNKPVRIRTRTQIINGVGMEASQDFRQWHIIRSTGTIQLPASKFPG